MVETINTRELVSACSRAIGYTSDLPPAGMMSERLLDTINEAIKHVYNKVQWPHLRLTESRIYRPPFDVIGFKKGQECYHDDKYWRATATPPMGIPGEANADWEEVNLGDIQKFIALDQPWELNKISIAGVHLEAFAYRRDPRYYPDEQPMTGCKFAGDYPGGGVTRVILPEDAPAVVYCAYLPRPPQLTLSAYQQGSTYTYGQRVMYEDNTWRVAVSSVSGSQPGLYNERAPWSIEAVPEFMVAAIKHYVRAEFLADEQGKAAAYQRYEAELHALVDIYFGQTAAYEGVTFEANYDN